MLTEDDSHGLLWRPSGHDSALPLQGEWVRSLVEELRSRKLHCVPKTNQEAVTEEGAENRSRSRDSEWGGTRDSNSPLGFLGNSQGGSGLHMACGMEG